MAAEAHGLPWLTVEIEPNASSPDVGRALEEILAPERALRLRAGLPRPSGLTWSETFSPHGTIALYSPHFAPDNLRRNTKYVGFAPYDRSTAGQSALSEPLRAFLDAGPPPLVATAGSAFSRIASKFFSEAMAAADALNRRLVITPAGHGEGAHLGDGVFACAYAPYSLLFSRAEALIHHCGIGTAGFALRASRPQLAVPFSADQPYNAQRLVGLGVARQLPIHQFTADAAAAELTQLLGDTGYAARARQVGESVQRVDGAQGAADAVEEFLTSHYPGT